MIEQTQDVMTRAAYATSAVTSSGGLWVWMGENSQAIGALGVIVGIVLGVLTFGINWYYKHQNYKK